MATIIFYELSAYNSGLLLDFTIELDGLCMQEEYHEAIHEALAQLKETYGKRYPMFTFEEWIVADHDDVPEQYVGEYGLDAKYWDYIEAVNEHGEEVVNAALECDVPMDKIEESYCGFHGDDSILTGDENRVLGNYAYQMAEDCGDLNEGSWLTQFIDWDAAGRALSHDGYCQHDGHVFHNVH